MTTLPEPVQKWIAELRSGKYKQAQGALHKVESGQDSYCCLGVACKLAVEEGLPITTRLVHGEDTKGRQETVMRYGVSTGALPSEVKEWLGVQSPYGAIASDPTITDYSSLANLNDEGATFEEIADTIEKRWEDLKS